MVILAGFIFFPHPLRLVNINTDIRFTEIKNTNTLEKSPQLKRLNEEQTNPNCDMPAPKILPLKTPFLFIRICLLTLSYVGKHA